MGHGRAQVQRIRIGGSRDGIIAADQLSVIQDSGAYPMMGSFLPFMTQRMTTGVYELPNAGFDAVSIATTTTPVASFRGAGRPEAAAARTGSSPHGQGHLTVWAMIISDRTGVPMENIEVLYGDTDEVPAGGITGGSRSAQLAGGCR